MSHDGSGTGEEAALDGASLWSAFRQAGNINVLTIEGQVQSDGTGVDIGYVATVRNQGDVEGSTYGMFSGGRLRLENAGTIRGDTGLGLEGVWFLNQLGSYISNSGLIAGHRHALRLEREHVSVSNSGTISSALQGEAAIKLDQTTVQLDPEGSPELATFRLENTGQILSPRIAFEGSRGTDTIINSGLIKGNIATFKDADRVENTGVIDGNISLGRGADVYAGFGGTLSGFVAGGSGNDTYYVDGGHIEIVEQRRGGVDEVHSTGDIRLRAHIEQLVLTGKQDISGTGNGLNNRILGNAGDNLLFGGDGADRILGRNGDDSISGGRGDDALDGGRGTDSLRGSGGNDTLHGRGSDDTLEGGAGQDHLAGGYGHDRLHGGGGHDLLEGEKEDDVIHGGRGHDTIIGGNGDDWMHGGSGRDTFVWTRYYEANRAAGADTVADFEAGVDLLDLQALNIRSLDLSGSDAPSGRTSLAVQHLGQSGRYKELLIAVDSGGDGQNDFYLTLHVRGPLDDDDFLI